MEQDISELLLKADRKRLAELMQENRELRTLLGILEILRADNQLDGSITFTIDRGDLLHARHLSFEGLIQPLIDRERARLRAALETIQELSSRGDRLISYDAVLDLLDPTPGDKEGTV